MNRRPGQPIRVGSPHPVGSSPGHSSRDEPLAHQGVVLKRRRQRLRVGKMLRRASRQLGQHLDRPIQVGRHPRGPLPVQQQVGVRVAPDGHQPVARHLGECLGAQRCGAVGPPFPGQHRLGCHVHRRRKLELVEDANDVLGEVGGAVVKRQRHGGIRAGTFGRKLVERLVQAQHPGGVSQPGHLISKPIEWQVHLRGAFAANPVVGQHHQPGGRQHRIGDPGEALQAAEQHPRGPVCGQRRSRRCPPRRFEPTRPAGSRRWSAWTARLR